MEGRYGARRGWKAVERRVMELMTSRVVPLSRVRSVVSYSVRKA